MPAQVPTPGQSPKNTTPHITAIGSATYSKGASTDGLEMRYACDIR